MVSTVEKRLDRLEERLGEVEQNLIRARRPRFALSVDEVKSRLYAPAERGPEQIARFRKIYGMFDGPPDLSERMRDYLYGEHD
jgi:hypothetical protein